MVILQFIMGFIMGIYLMVIVSGHLATKNVMAALKGDGSHSGRAKRQQPQKPF